MSARGHAQKSREASVAKTITTGTTVGDSLTVTCLRWNVMQMGKMIVSKWSTKWENCQRRWKWEASYRLTDVIRLCTRLPIHWHAMPPIGWQLKEWDTLHLECNLNWALDESRWWLGERVDGRTNFTSITHCVPWLMPGQADCIRRGKCNQSRQSLK